MLIWAFLICSLHLSSLKELLILKCCNICTDANLSASQITAMGISTQRSTFINWSKTTGKHYHNFITWKDLRADKLVKDWNESFTWKVVNEIYFVTVKGTIGQYPSSVNKIKDQRVFSETLFKSMFPAGYLGEWYHSVELDQWTVIT